jgi:threonine/homoserine/homoserine lactone efflux protein
VPSIDHYAAFIAASLLLLLIPGPAVIYIATRSASQGRAAGLVSVAGIATGGLVHVIGAAVGVSAILARSAVAMQYVRWLGAAYLIWLGVQKLREASAAAVPAGIETRRSPLGKIYKDGVIVNVFNPKTALFFLAFLPQFGSTLPQLLLLGTTFVVMAVITDSAYALAAAGIAAAARKHARFGRAGAYLSSAVYIGLGLATAAQARAK